MQDRFDILAVMNHDKDTQILLDNLSFYLKQKYGENILKFFDVDTQKLINDIKLYEKGNPISSADMDLESTKKYYKSLGFNISITTVLKDPTLA